MRARGGRGGSPRGAAGTVTHIAVGTANGGTDTCAPSYPAGISAGDILLLCVCMSTNDGSAPAVTTPAGWTLVGSHVGTANGSFRQSTWVYRKNTVTGSEAGAVTVNDASAGGYRLYGQILQARSSTSNYVSASAGGEYLGSSTTTTIVLGSDPGLAASDLGYMTVCSQANAGDFSSPALSAAGVTFGAATEYLDVDNGVSFRAMISGHPVATGTSAGVPTFTASRGASDPRSSGLLVRLRAT